MSLAGAVKELVVTMAARSASWIADAVPASFWTSGLPTDRPTW